MAKQISEFGKRLELILCENNMTQAELARKIGVLRENVSHMKKVKRPSFPTIHKVAKACRVPVGYFLSS